MRPQWSNYGRVFDLLPLGRMLVNTAGCVTAGQVLFCSLAGYAFARLRVPGRAVLFVAYLAPLMVPPTVGKPLACPTIIGGGEDVAHTG